jgi:hypothetical protein
MITSFHSQALSLIMTGIDTLLAGVLGTLACVALVTTLSFYSHRDLTEISSFNLLMYVAGHRAVCA